MHNSSDMKAILDAEVTSIHSLPANRKKSGRLGNRNKLYEGKNIVNHTMASHVASKNILKRDIQNNIHSVMAC